MNISLKPLDVAVALALALGPGLPAADAGNYCYFGPGMGCGNNSGMADSTTVGRGVGPAPQVGIPAWGGQSSDAMAQAIIAAENGQLSTYYPRGQYCGGLYSCGGPSSPPGGYTMVAALPSGPSPADIPAWRDPGADSCTSGYFPYLYSNGSQYVLVQSFFGYGCSCFPAGARVLMADGTERLIQFVAPGDWLMGADGRPVQVRHVDRPLLGHRRMMAFADGSQIWSEEHGFWTRDAAGAEWWWSANPDQWRFEADTGHIGGLRDNASMRAGDGFEFAHMNGWVGQMIVEAEGFGPDTQLFLPRTDGVPIIVNGYVVGAGVNEDGYDYASLRWSPQAVYDNLARQALARVLWHCGTHAAQLPEDPIERARRISRLQRESPTRVAAMV